MNSVEAQRKTHSILIRHIALPQDHGSWVFLLSPLLIGLFADRNWSTATLFLILGAFAGFLMRQPVTIAVKAYSGRRSRRELPAAWFWISIYGLAGLTALFGLVLLGFNYLLLLAILGIPVFAWHLYLVSRRAERRQIGVELVGSGVLALAAPAAYWVSIGRPVPIGWLLFILVWLQSAASIVYAYLRLDQRTLSEKPVLSVRIKMGWRAIAYGSFNLLFVSILSAFRIVPAWLFLPYALQWIEIMRGVYSPALHIKPTSIGFRQLFFSALFTVLFIITWNL